MRGGRLPGCLTSALPSSLLKKDRLDLAQPRGTLHTNTTTAPPHPRAGINTIGTVRREEQKAEVLAAGATVAVCTETEDLVARVKEATGGAGADAAVDSVAGALAAEGGF